MNEIEIAGRKIGPAHPPYIVAEISGNHNGKIDKALQLVEQAKEAGADAVKLQTYTADTMTIPSEKEDFKISGGLWDGYTLHDLYKVAHTPWDWHPQLFELGEKLGITVFSSPFDESAVDFLMELNAPAFKVASFEMLDLPLIEYIAQQKKPMVMSTGMATQDEIAESVQVIHNQGHEQLILLHCISGYPTPVDQANVRNVRELQQRFPKVIAGLSDHTLSNAVSVAAVACGACFIEKHFIDSRDNEGVDSAFSIEPHELKQLVNDTRDAWAALGEVSYELKAAEKDNTKFRRSCYFVKDIKKGETITKENLRRIRPGYGLEPKFYSELLGKTVNQNVEAGTPSSWEFVNR